MKTEEQKGIGQRMDVEDNVDINMMNVDDGGYVCICDRHGRVTKVLPCRYRPVR